MSQISKAVYFLFFSFVLVCNINAKKLNEDSLLQMIPRVADSSKAKIYIQLLRIHFQTPADSELVNKYYLEGLRYARKSKQDILVIELHSNYAGLYKFLGKYDAADAIYKENLNLSKKISYAKGIASSYLSLGLIQNYKGNLKDAIAYYVKAEGIFNELKLISNQAICLNNLAEAYVSLKDYKSALSYHRKAYKLYLTVDDKYRASISLYNIGNVFIHLTQNDSALFYTEKSLAISFTIPDYEGIVLCYTNLGVISAQMNKNEEAVKYLKKAYKYADTLKVYDLLAQVCNSLGGVMVKMNNAKEAISYGLKGLELSKQFQRTDVQRDATYILSEAYFLANDHKNAFIMLKETRKLADSLLNTENLKVMQEMQARFNSEKKETEIKFLNNENALQQTKIEKDKTFKKGLLGIIGLATMLLFVLVYAFNNKRKSNNVLKELNREIQVQNTEIVKKSNELKTQKLIVEEKNQEILDSIHYAQKIQQAILPSVADFNDLLPGSFVFFKPKDIVSGDFPWITKVNNYVFFAAVDCTGHGVPGGFMSMLGVTLLNEIINQKEILEPEKILDELREGVIAALKQTGVSGENQDGMDICLCRYEEKTRQVIFAGANNSMYHFTSGELKEIKGDKQPIGIHAGFQKSFTQKQFNMQIGDQIYLLTDGYADQFGGPNGKKFKYKALEEIFVEIAGQSPQNQGLGIKNRLEEWQGNYEQMDDILIIGFQL